MPATYTIDHPRDVLWGEYLWSDHRSGTEVAHFRWMVGPRDTFALPIGVPLCSGCDGIATSGFCASCDEPAEPCALIPPRRLASVHPCLVSAHVDTIHRIAKGG